ASIARPPARSAPHSPDVRKRFMVLLFVVPVFSSGIPAFGLFSRCLRIALPPTRLHASRTFVHDERVFEWFGQKNRILDGDDDPHGVLVHEVITLGYLFQYRACHMQVIVDSFRIKSKVGRFGYQLVSFPVTDRMSVLEKFFRARMPSAVHPY